MLASTTGEIAGFKAVRDLGVVHFVSLRAVGAVGETMGAMQTFMGGKLSAYSDLYESAIKESFDKMCERAGQMGANAVIGVRWEGQGFITGALGVNCYGTAVLVEPL
jgi:uncharacterized protein YbjQ (UPF0145 family)